MKWEIVTYEGVGPVRFGMTREQVRKALGKPSKSFMKAGVEPRDAYHKHMVHACYDSQGQLAEVEAFEGSTIEWRGIELFKLSYMQLYDLLTEDGSPVAFDDDVLASLIHGIGLWAPFGDDEEEREVKSIGAFRRGYWEQAPMEDV